MTTCDPHTTGTKNPEKHDRFTQNRLQEPILIKAWRENKDGKSLQRLIDNYQPLFGMQIKQILAGRSVNTEHRDDLRQECTLAFIKAVDAFDQSMNVSLAAFAQPKIRGALLTYSLDFRSSYRIGKGSDERKAYYAAQKLRARKAGEGDGTISETDIEKISKSTGSSMKATRRAVESTQTSQTSLDEPHENLVSKDHGEHYIDTSAHRRAMQEVNTFLKGISERNRLIIQKSFLSDDDPSNVDLSKAFDVSPERIGQIKRDVLKGLANHLVEAGLQMEDIL